VAVLPVLVAVAAGCGGSSDRKPAVPDTAADIQTVRQVVSRFGAASAAKDYRTICRVLLAPGLVRDIETIGLPCEAALERGLGGVRHPQLRVGAARVRGANASVATHSTADGQPPSDDLVELVRIRRRWYVATLASGGDTTTETTTVTTPRTTTTEPETTPTTKTRTTKTETTPTTKTQTTKTETTPTTKTQTTKTETTPGKTRTSTTRTTSGR
jgi:hypothetical protein